MFWFTVNIMLHKFTNWIDTIYSLQCFKIKEAILTEKQVDMLSTVFIITIPMVFEVSNPNYSLRVGLDIILKMETYVINIFLLEEVPAYQHYCQRLEYWTS